MRVLSIAFNTFRENLREKLLYNLLIFALLMIGSSVLLARLTVGEWDRLIIDLGLSSMNIFGVLIAIFVGISLVSKEIDKKTIFTIISKPVPRYEFLLGKYLGLVVTLLINTAVMAAGLLAVMAYLNAPVTPMLFMALGFIFLEFLVITAVALVFSTFTSTTLSAIFTLAIYVVGHLSTDLKLFGAKMDDVGRAVLNAIYYILPNLERFNLKGNVIHHVGIPATDLVLSAAYGLTYAAFLLLLASIIFQRRDFQ
jgi:ABC-type transport system involved in multi-copper enzyme maturation permease subunit